MRRLVVLPLVLASIACNEPLAPTVQAPQTTTGARIVLGSLGFRDTVTVAYHVQGCFIRYDARFFIYHDGQAINLAGSIRFPRVTPGPRDGRVPVRALNQVELRRLDRMLDLYRAEAQPGGCTGMVRIDMTYTRPNEATLRESWYDGGCANVQRVPLGGGVFDLRRP